MRKSMKKLMMIWKSMMSSMARPMKNLQKSKSIKFCSNSTNSIKKILMISQRTKDSCSKKSLKIYLQKVRKMNLILMMNECKLKERSSSQTDPCLNEKKRRKMNLSIRTWNQKGKKKMRLRNQWWILRQNRHSSFSKSRMRRWRERKSKLILNRFKRWKKWWINRKERKRRRQLRDHKVQQSNQNDLRVLNKSVKSRRKRRSKRTKSHLKKPKDSMSNFKNSKLITDWTKNKSNNSKLLRRICNRTICKLNSQNL